MALTPCMSCMKQCGYLCGGLAALNIWFWIGMTVFNAMGNPWIKKEILLMPSFDSDTERFTTVFAIVAGVSTILSNKCLTLLSNFLQQLNVLCMIGCCWCTTSKCYQDKDAIEYYVGGGARVSSEFKASIQRDSGALAGPSGIVNNSNDLDAGDGKLIR